MLLFHTFPGILLPQSSSYSTIYLIWNQWKSVIRVFYWFVLCCYINFFVYVIMFHTQNSFIYVIMLGLFHKYTEPHTCWNTGRVIARGPRRRDIFPRVTNRIFSKRMRFNIYVINNCIGGSKDIFGTQHAYNFYS